MADKIAGGLRTNFLNAFRQQQIKKKQLLEDITHESVTHEAEISGENINESSLFNESNVNQGSETTNLFNKYILTENNFSEVVAKDFNPNIVSNLLASYMSLVEMDLLFSYIDGDSFSKDDVNELLEEICNAEDGEVSGLINGFLNGNELAPEAIFAVLTYLYEEIKQKKTKKEKTLSLLKQLLEKYSQQNSAYLAEFFQMTNNKNVKKSPKMAAGLANLASGKISIESLKGTIKFIDDFLDSDYENIVSKCIRLRLQVLVRMTKPQLSFEEKTELSSYLQCEKSLISINSINSDYKKFRHTIESEVLKNSATQTKASQVLTSIIDFVENSMIGAFALRMLLNSLGVDKEYHGNTHLKTKLVEMFAHMPMILFNDDHKKRLKFIDSMRTFKNSGADGNVIAPEKEIFNFIKPRRTPIKLV